MATRTAVTMVSSGRGGACTVLTSLLLHDTESVRSLTLFGEVKLGISGLPGYQVLAAQKAKINLARAQTALQTRSDNRAKTSGESAVDEDTSIFHSIPFRKSSTSQRPRRKETPTTGPPKMETDMGSGGVVEAQVDSMRPPGEEAPARSRSVAPTPDLTSVKEEKRMEEATEQPRRAPLSLNTSNLSSDQSPAPRKPRLMVQSPSENGLAVQPPEEGPSRPGDTITPFSSHPASVLSSHSEMEEQDEEAIAQDKIQACEQSLSRASLAMHDSPSSSMSAFTDGQGSESDSEDSNFPAMNQDEFLLNLEHGQELTKKERKRLVRLLRRSRSGQPRAGAADIKEVAAAGAIAAGKQHSRKGSLSNKVQVGLQYASSQSRNRRAMERYSPHPSRPSSTAPVAPLAPLVPSKVDSADNLAELLASARRQSMSGATPQPLHSLVDFSRSSTPGLRESGAGSRRSSLSEKDRAAEVGEGGDFCLSPTAESTVDREDRWTELSRYLPRRQGTASSITSSVTGNPSFRRKYMSLLRRRQNPSDVVEESDSDHHTPKDDGEVELDKMLGRLVAQQAPDELKELFEYDVLYENQRGLMVFGIPKFSAKTLFQWDPASWTNVYNGNSAYNIVNAQLPDPSWEWVHPEWMIDMSGDVDESGWQYSYNFGRFTTPLFTRPTQIIPRANAKGNEIMNERMARMADRRHAKETSREDDGFEALKRTARARSAKWTGIPNQNKYVRRRRWIRLRKRKALPFSATASNTPAAGTPLGMGKASGEWSHLVEEEQRRKERREAREENASSSDDESLSNLESDETDSVAEYASDGAGSSVFLPRHTPGNLRNGPEPTAFKVGKEQERQKRHAREFTGTIRELKSLLPAILDQRHRLPNRQRVEKELWLTEVDARNPFISWSLVKRRLDDDDLAFAGTSLRARERRYAQRALERKSRASQRRTSSVSATESKDADMAGPHEQSYNLTKDALVEINFRRVMRIMRACKVDRQKLQLWKIWLAVEPISSITEVAREEDLTYAGLGIQPSTSSDSQSQEKREARQRARGRWRKSLSTPDAMDVWDLLERRLDRLLLMFEYQGSRATLLRLLLTLHASSHANHRFRHSHWKIEADNGATVEPNVPSSLSPQFGSREQARTGMMGTVPAGDEWRAVRLPRLEFWSDLETCARAVLDGSASSAIDDSSPVLHDSSTPMAMLHNTSPTSSSILRASTSQPMTGSLANGPAGRRFSHHLPSASVRMGSTPSGNRIGSPASTTLSNGETGERDRSFLAELLQLPLQTQKELLVKTGIEREEGDKKSTSRAAEGD